MAIRTFDELLRNHTDRIGSLERRLNGSGGGGSGGGTTLLHFPGDVWEVSSGILPPNTLWCDGRAVSRTTYAELFTKIGTTYGKGDGTTTFNLPNLNGRELMVPNNAPLARWNLSNVFRPVSSAESQASLTDTYEIRAQFTIVSAAMLPRMRFSTGGTDNTAASYQFIRQWLNTTAIQRTVDSNISMVYLGAGSDGRQTLQMMVQRAGAADYTDFTWDQTERNSSSSTVIMTGQGYYGANVAFDGITFFNEAGPMAGFLQVIPFGGSMVPSVIATTTVTGAGLPAPGGVEVPALPAPRTVYGPDSYPIPSTSWTDMPGSISGLSQVSLTVPYPLWVRADFSAQISGSGSAYGMIGVVCTGALFLAPEQDQVTGANPKFSNAPFSTNANINISGSKTVLIPAGTTVITMQSRKSGATATNADYSGLVVTPLYWMNAPGLVKPAGEMIARPPVSVVNSGGTATVLGHKVTFDSIASLSLNGVFDWAIAEDYVIECVITGATNGGWIRMRKNGVDQSGAVYGNQQTYNNAAGTLTTTYAATSGFIFAPTIGAHGKFTAKISNAPNPSTHTCYLDMSTLIQQTSYITNGTNKGTSTGASYDGFSLVSASGVISGWLRVYALT